MTLPVVSPALSRPVPQFGKGKQDGPSNRQVATYALLGGLAASTGLVDARAVAHRPAQDDLAGLAVYPNPAPHFPVRERPLGKLKQVPHLVGDAEDLRFDTFLNRHLLAASTPAATPPVSPLPTTAGKPSSTPTPSPATSVGALKPTPEKAGSDSLKKVTEKLKDYKPSPEMVKKLASLFSSRTNKQNVNIRYDDPNSYRLRDGYNPGNPYGYVPVYTSADGGYYAVALPLEEKNNHQRKIGGWVMAGVGGAIGALLLGVGGFFGYQWLKKRQEMKHQTAGPSEDVEMQAGTPGPSNARPHRSSRTEDVIALPGDAEKARQAANFKASL